MSVLIKGMDMPISCWDCFLRKDCDEIIIWSKRRPRKCPLVEVPTPHGRLIDADSVENQIDYVANLDWNRKVGASGGMFAALEIVEDALAIIESEGE